MFRRSRSRIAQMWPLPTPRWSPLPRENLKPPDGRHDANHQPDDGGCVDCEPFVVGMPRFPVAAPSGVRTAQRIAPPLRPPAPFAENVPASDRVVATRTLGPDPIRSDRCLSQSRSAGTTSLSLFGSRGTPVPHPLERLIEPLVYGTDIQPPAPPFGKPVDRLPDDPCARLPRSWNRCAACTSKGR